MKIKDPLGTTTENPDKIADIFVSHFHNILNNFDSSNMIAQEKMLEDIPKVVSIEDNKALNSPISLKEVKFVLFNMNSDSSPDPNGFQAFFD